jgi:hypothetical protein
MGSREELLRRLPKEGFLKITAAKPAAPAKLAEGERVALIRKGNELFNLKKFDLARKIFMTTGYSDGLIRLGDLYLKESKPLEAFRMYLLAPDRKKVEAMLEKSVAVLRHWLTEGSPQAAPVSAGSAAAPAAAPVSATGSAPAAAEPAPPKPQVQAKPPAGQAKAPPSPAKGSGSAPPKPPAKS